MIAPLNLTGTFFSNHSRAGAGDPASSAGSRASAAASWMDGAWRGEPVPPAADAEGKGTGESGGGGKEKGRFDSYECETCRNRKYQDGSDDPGVSFKTPTKLGPSEAASSVRAHENEHVTREQAKAAREGRKVVSQSVSYHTGICPECGGVYVSGGTTRTVTKGQVDQAYGLAPGEERGKFFDMSA